jgi:phosphatidate phosphatase APP1
LPSWKRSVVAAGRTSEEWFDRLRFGLKRWTGRIGPVEILPYRGHGTRERLFLKGRVLETPGLKPSSAGDSRRRNLRNMARRFFSSEVPHARVRASHGRYETEVTADEEGFFDVRLELAQPLKGETDWYPVQIEVAWPRSERGARATGSVLVPTGARFGVVSDLDDTVVYSSATNLLRMARITLLSNAHTRLPFEGVAAFYRALQRGRSGGERNPIFYVSNGPWNLYDMIEELFDVHGIPGGPVFLRDWSPTKLQDHGEHKLGVIRTLLATYPDLPFVMIGDSGEQDPEIYRRIVYEHPDRILAVYIRDVTTPERDAEVRKISKELLDLGVEMLLTSGTAEAAGHAEGLGLVPPAAARGVESGSGH